MVRDDTVYRKIALGTAAFRPHVSHSSWGLHDSPHSEALAFPWLLRYLLLHSVAPRLIQVGAQNEIDVAAQAKDTSRLEFCLDDVMSS